MRDMNNKIELDDELRSLARWVWTAHEDAIPGVKVKELRRLFEAVGLTAEVVCD